MATTRSKKFESKLNARASYRPERGREEQTGQETVSAKRKRPLRNASATVGVRNMAANDSRVKFGREVCGNLDAAEAREWIVTNGI